MKRRSSEVNSYPCSLCPLVLYASCTLKRTVQDIDWTSKGFPMLGFRFNGRFGEQFDGRLLEGTRWSFVHLFVGQPESVGPKMCGDCLGPSRFGIDEYSSSELLEFLDSSLCNAGLEVCIDS